MSLDPITAGLTAVGDIVTLTAQELAYLNSPENQAARNNVAIQAHRDKVTKDATDALAGKSAAIENVDLDLS